MWGGAITALKKMMDDIEGIEKRFTKVSMMMCAWNAGGPGSQNLFPNQFNAACELNMMVEQFCNQSKMSNCDM